MTSHAFEQAQNRIKLLNNQLPPSDDCLREMSTFTFDFEKVAKEIRNLRPESFYECADSFEQSYEGK